MAWSITTGAVTESSGTSLATSKPTGVVGGDLLVLLVGRELGSTWNTLTGWTLDANASVSTFSSTSRCDAYYRIADGTADDEPTLTSAADQSQTAVMLRITGHAATPFDVAGNTGAGSSASDTVIPTPALTIAENASLLVGVAMNRTETVSYTWPAAWTEHVDHGSGGTIVRPHRMGVATREVAAGGYASENITLSASNDRRCCVALAFKPAGGGGPTRKPRRRAFDGGYRSSQLGGYRA